MILVAFGPNLSQLGTRDPAVYGTATVDQLAELVRAELGAVAVLVTESEAELVARCHAARTDGTRGVILNPGALTHYSYALRDAVELLNVPVVEVHLSQTAARERFRHASVVSAVAAVTITGAGATGYRLAALALSDLLDRG